MREYSIVHGYDGWEIFLIERPWYKIIGENLWFDICDYLLSPFEKLAYRIESRFFPEYAGMTEWKLLNNRLSHWLFKDKRRVCYPVHEDWVAENFPEVLDRDREMTGADTELKDPAWGTTCPVCGYGRVNDEPASWIARAGHCLRCEIAAKITYQDPHS